MHSIRIIGPGRAGTSLAAALSARGWVFAGFLGRHDQLARAAAGVDLLVIATPDDAVAEVAAAVLPSPGTTVAHLSGSLGLDVLAPHPLRAAVHPLVPLPNGEVGAARLGSGVTFAVAGAPLARDVVTSLGGRMVEVADDDRAAYHAAACIAANHVVALLGQVERVATSVGLDLESFLPLTRAAVDDVASLGAGPALTGPARRGDWATLSRHLDALARVRARRLPGRGGAGHPPGPRGRHRAGRAGVGRCTAGRSRAGRDAAGRRTPHRDAAGRAGGGVGGHGGGRGDRRRLSRRAGPGARQRARGRAGAHHGCAARGAHLAADPGRGRSVTWSPSASSSTPSSSATPRTSRTTRGPWSGDLAVCAQAGADVVFVPSVAEMYPSWPTAPSTTVSVRRRERGVGGRVPTGTLRRRGHGGGQAVRRRRSLPGLLRVEGLPTAGRRAAPGA